jgi:L-serine deaminase
MCLNLKRVAFINGWLHGLKIVKVLNMVACMLLKLWIWLAGCMPQAGVAMGLARIAGTAFSGWGPAFQTVMMAIIMVNMLTGPPFFRAALIKVGGACIIINRDMSHQAIALTSCWSRCAS